MGLFNNNHKNNNSVGNHDAADLYYSVDDCEAIPNGPPTTNGVKVVLAPSPSTKTKDKSKQSAELVELKGQVKCMRWWLRVLSLVLGFLVMYVAWHFDTDTLSPRVRDARWRVVLLASIPIVAMLFTWFHIWLAIEMMFLPTKFVGCCEIQPGLGLGWQGVVPRKARKMATIACRSARPFLMEMDEVLGRIDGEDLIRTIDSDLRQVIQRALVRVGTTRFPDVWKNLPQVAREELGLAVIEATQIAVPKTLRLVRPIMGGLDYEDMIVPVFEAKKELLNNFFRQIGAKEFIFIERCGAALGFICGTIQLIAFQYLSPLGQMIFLPLTGFLLGNFSNWAALKACFWPIDPVTVCIFGKKLFTSQGLFLKRQPEVCTLYSDLLVQHFFNLDRTIGYLKTQQNVWKQLIELRKLTMKETVNHSLGSGITSFRSVSRNLDPFINSVVDVILEEVANDKALNAKAEKYMIVASDIEETNASRMQKMTPSQFENLLHPVFQEDEWILILLGGVLGAIVGIGQVIVLGH